MFNSKSRAVLFIVIISQLAFSDSSNIMRSIIFPGWGEMKMGYDSRAKIFISSELLILGTYFFGNSFSDWTENQYRGYAELHADVDMDDKDYAFVVNMSKHDSMEEYNHYMMIHHNTNYFEDVYSGESYSWEWDSTDNRLKFDKIRRNSVVSGTFAEFAIAGLIVNRIVSAIDVIYLNGKDSKIKNLSANILPDEYDGVVPLCAGDKLKWKYIF